MSDDRITMRLCEPVQAYRAILKAWACAKPMLMAGHRLVLEISPETRTSQQNRLLHALISDVAKQKEWMGKKLPPESWKVLFVSGHSVATNQGAEIVPGLEREFVNIRESTAHMTKARLASLIDYIQAWAAQNDVKFIESRKWMVDMDTGEIS